MSTFTIIVNILFLVSVLIILIIQKKRADRSEVYSPRIGEELPESDLEVSGNSKTLITSIVITWIMFNIASFQFTRIAGIISSNPGTLSSLLSTIALIALVILNILFLGGFIYTVITQSKVIVAVSVILWVLSNIFIQFIVAVIVVCAIGAYILLSSSSGDGNSWTRPIRRKGEPIDDEGGGWFMQQEDNDGEK